MAAIWRDLSDSNNNVVLANNQENLVFRWKFITFSGEAQEFAEIKWRKMGAANLYASAGIIGFMRDSTDTAAIWSTPVQVGRLEDTTTWTLSGGQMVPPIEANRRYTDIEQVVLPLNTFTAGTWAFAVRAKPVGQDWLGWTVHKVEISDYSDRQNFAGSSAAAVKGPAFPNEGEYGVRVEVMSAPGITTMSSEQTFDVWSTDKYLLSGGIVQAVPEHRHNGTTVGRVRRNV